VAAPDHRARIGCDQLPVAGDAHQVRDPSLQSGVEHIVLLLDHLRVVAGDDEDAGHALERLFERRPVGQFGDRRLRIGSQNLARLLRVAHDADGVLAQRLERLDHRPPGIPSRTDNSDHCVRLCCMG
jgi:hypothetical protein